MVRILDLEKYAQDNNIPIMLPDGIEFLLDYIKKNNIKSILEIGSAIGYSAIRMALISNDIKVTTIERDEIRYNEAIKNIKEFNLEKQINIILDDALNTNINDKFDLIFIDAAKGKNKEFFNHFEKNLKIDGYIITDNMGFHGYVEMNEEEIPSKNIRGIVTKIKDYIYFLENNMQYKTIIYKIGDGIAVTERR
jgi:predicted O-methyltransferase YrrM